MQKIIKIKNLDCANCATGLAEELSKIEGVKEAVVDFMGQRVNLNYESDAALERAIFTITHFEEVEIDEGIKKRIIKIRNLDCANCAAELAEELNKIEGISEASVDFMSQRVDLSYDGQESLNKAIYAISHFEEVEIVESGAPEKKERRLKEILSIAISALFFIPALVLHLLNEYGNYQTSEWIILSLFLAAFVAAGWSVAVNAGKNFVRAFRGGFHPTAILDENILMLIASVAAFAIREYMEGAAVMLLYQIGELLQSIAVGSSRGAISKLLEMQSDTAILLERGSQRVAINKLLEMQSSKAVLIDGAAMREVPCEELQVGDIILIRKGDKVPIDCRIVEGVTSLDTKSLTGESVYREAEVGAELLGGCVNVGNAIKAEVLRLSTDSAVSKILNMVENSSAKKAKPEKFITRFARIYTPVVVLLAVLIAVIPPLFQGYNFSTWLVPAIEFLVISCPCALIISVPLTYFSGVGTLARHGVLTKGAVYLDELAKVDVAAFDKTGTLTEGKFSIAKVNGQERVLELAGAVEKSSSHPLAQAFVGVNSGLVVENTEEIAGMGLSATVGGKTVLVGSLRLMESRGIKCAPVESLAAVIYVAEDGVLLGSIEIEDKIRSEAKTALDELKKVGIKKTALLTGDSRARAEAAFGELPLDEVHAELLPDQKLERARELKKSGVLLYVGDGINDTPVMAESDVSVAMGALGSDAAIEASDFVLASDNLSSLPKAIKGAKKTRRIVRQNIVFSIAVKIALMVLSVVAASGSLFALPIWAAVFGDVGVMLLAVLNSMRMRMKIK